MTYQILGQIAGIFALVAYGIYAATTISFGKKTKPNRATWWILTLVGAIVAESYYSSGAEASMWIALSYVIGPLLIAVISLHKNYGVGGWENSFDRRCLKIAFFGALVSIILRKIFPAYADTSLLINIAIDFVGILPTVIKSYKEPEHEDRIAWGFTFLATPFALLSVEETTFFILVYPVYLFIMNGLIFSFILNNRFWKKVLKV